MGAWIKQLLPDYTVRNGQQSFEGMPSPPLCIIQLLHTERLGTNDTIYNPADATTRVINGIKRTIQVGVFGQSAGDACHLINTLWRSRIAADFFLTNYSSLAPLFSEEPMQHAFVGAGKDYENNWSVDLHLNVVHDILLKEPTADALSFQDINGKPLSFTVNHDNSNSRNEL